MIMGVITLILSVIAVVNAVIALVIASKKQEVVEVVTKEKTVKVEHAPVEHPFTYDESKHAYTLNGDLEVTGGITCLKEKEGE